MNALTYTETQSLHAQLLAEPAGTAANAGWYRAEQCWNCALPTQADSSRTNTAPRRNPLPASRRRLRAPLFSNSVR